jgi:hypothetical protein
MEARELLTSPLTVLAFVVSAIGSVGFGLLDPTWGLISATAGMWFPAVAVTAGTILPEIGYGDVGTQVLVAAAVVFVAVQLDRLADRAADYYKERWK